MKRHLFNIVLVLLWSSSPVLAQASQSWVRSFNGTQNQWDEPVRMLKDSDGNIIVTGITTERIDSVKIWFDVITIKYNPAGDTLWTRIYNGPGSPSEETSGLALDADNNIYICASWDQLEDKQSVIIKYSAGGVEEWSRQIVYAGGQVIAKDIVTDTTGNIYIAASAGIIGAENILLQKYSSEGDSIWRRELDLSYDGSDIVNDLDIDPQGNIFITGNVRENGTTGYTDIISVKFSSFGDTLWTRIYQGGQACDFDFGHIIRANGQGGAYVAGLSENDHGGGPEGDYVVIRYDSGGNQEWAVPYDGGYGGDWPVDLITDSSGGIYVTGWSISENDTKSTATLKYDSLGTVKWIKRYDGIGFYFNDPSALALAPGDILLVATKVADNEFRNDWVIIAYRRSDGDSLWAVQYDGTGTEKDIDSPRSVIADGQGYFYVTGFTDEINHDWDITTIKYQCPALDVHDPVRDNPVLYSLSQNYPNPFNPSTMICYHLAVSGKVTLKIYNSLGQEVRTLVNEKQSAGFKQVMWDGMNNQGHVVPSGLYIYRIVAGSFIKSNKMMLIK